ncbi:YjcQ family protein [Lentibacillus jeotgali]|uniref:YjcQ family protein n=1 Tax=Lentibacillus jeotgali TaxID=558169 RepID=UPI0002627821|nr:YjcQ family protein [Lentibacillus jeotgali]
MNKKQKLRYAILKEVYENNTPLSEKDFHVEEEEFDEAVRFLTRENYLMGVMYADNRPHLNKIGPELTEKGERYLDEHSALSKTYKGLKEVREWFKL